MMNKNETRIEERIDDGFIVGWPLDASISPPSPWKGRRWKDHWISRHLFASRSGVEGIEGVVTGVLPWGIIYRMGKKPGFLYDWDDEHPFSTQCGWR